MIHRVIKEEREREKRKMPASIIGTNIAVEKFDYTMKPRGKQDISVFLVNRCRKIGISRAGPAQRGDEN